MHEFVQSNECEAELGDRADPPPGAAYPTDLGDRAAKTWIGPHIFCTVPHVRERRISERIAVALRAQFRSSDFVTDGVVEDLSRTGLFLRTRTCDAIGSRGLVELDLPDRAEPLRLAAAVVRVEAPPGSNAEPGMGIVFCDVAGDARRPLANLMMHWAHASAPPPAPSN